MNHPNFPQITESQILFLLSSLASKNEVRLTISQKGFFVSLYSLFVSSASFDDERGKYFLQYSCRDFANLLQFSLDFTYKALRNLHDCGAIERVPIDLSFRKINAKTYESNQPYLTFLNLDFLNVERSV